MKLMTSSTSAMAKGGGKRDPSSNKQTKKNYKNKIENKKFV